jgi:hypothetical protein
MSLFLIGTVFAQDTTQSAPAQDTTQSAPAQDTTQAAPAQDTTQAAPDATQATPPAEAAQAAPAPEASGAAPKSSFAFSGGVGLGSDVLLTGAADLAGNATPQTWTRLDFMPDFTFGKIGIGFDFTLHFMLYPDSNTSFLAYSGDWIPQNGKNLLDVYLPKILYVRYGQKGEDPFFAKLGSIDDLSLGDGFIMSDYSNMRFLPQQRLFGLDVGLDGSLFNVPYVGIEALTGNLARFDVVGGRLFVRPLAGTEIPLLKSMQVGATAVADTNPGLYAPTATPADTVVAYGADIAVPIVGGKAFPLTTFTDLAFDPNQSAGWMIGLSGRLIGIFTYGAQLRVLQDGFIPSYFDANYDIYRAQRFDFMQLAPGSGVSTGWYASLGTSLLKDKLVFNAALDGPFRASGTTLASDPAQTDYPHLRSVLSLGEIPGFPFFFDASYEKYLLGARNGFFPDLVDPTDAVIGLAVNYRTGASVLTMLYNAQWDPTAGKFDVMSSLQASVQF